MWLCDWLINLNLPNYYNIKYCQSQGSSSGPPKFGRFFFIILPPSVYMQYSLIRRQRCSFAVFTNLLNVDLIISESSASEKFVFLLYATQILYFGLLSKRSSRLCIRELNCSSLMKYTVLLLRSYLKENLKIKKNHTLLGIKLYVHKQIV